MAFNDYQETLKNQKIATEESSRARRLRTAYSQKVTSGDLPFHQLVSMSKDPELKALGKINVLKLLSAFPGWTETSARYAFVANGLSDSLKVRDCHDDRVRIILSTLMDSSAASWQKRVQAPPGWPWFGNIANTLADLDGVTLPKELREVRYRFADEEPETTATEKKLTPEEVSEEITEALGGRRQKPVVEDNLDDLFGVDEEPDIPPHTGVHDGLDDLFGDEDEDDNDNDNEGAPDQAADGDTLSDEEINAMLGF